MLLHLFSPVVTCSPFLPVLDVFLGFWCTYFRTSLVGIMDLLWEVYRFFPHIPLAKRGSVSRLVPPLSVEASIGLLSFCEASPRVPRLLRGIHLGSILSFYCSFPRIPFTGRGRVSCTMLPLVVNIMVLGVLRLVDPNEPFFLWSEPPSPPFATGYSSRRSTPYF
jgi:hypothetical protein